MATEVSPPFINSTSSGKGNIKIKTKIKIDGLSQQHDTLIRPVYLA